MLQPRGSKTARPLSRAELERVRARFESHVHAEPNTGCWLWDGATTAQGYGQLWVRRDGKRYPLLAHRVAYALERGDVELGADLIHSCDNPLCCSPAHIRPGNGTANNEDMDRRNRRVRGPRHWNYRGFVGSRLTLEQQLELRVRLLRGARPCDVARAFDLTQRQVHRINAALRGATP